MDKLFLTILNMSLTGAFVIAAICIARLPLKKAPKTISYCLWAVAGFRLVFPFSIESIFSLIPFKAQPIPQDIAMQAIPRIDSGIGVIDNAISVSLPSASTVASVNPLQIWQFAGSCIWLFGVVLLLVYGGVSFVMLKRKMENSTHNEANIYEAENIQSPFVLGVFKPKIYLPIDLSEQERDYITLHEQTHIRRHDHIIKFAAYFILCLHWFNPLVWVAFLLMGADMEMSCDERVLKEMGVETKKDYSLSLLSLAAERRVIGGSPLAFSEIGLKARIKNVLSFQKPSRVIIITSVVLVAALSVGFAVNRIGAQASLLEPNENYSGESIDDAVKWYLNNIESDKYLRGHHFVSSYRILDMQVASDRVNIYTHILCEWLSPEGETISGGAGLVLITFAKDGSTYSYKESIDYIKPTDYDLPQKVIDAVSTASYFDDMRLEIDKAIAEYNAIREFGISPSADAEQSNQSRILIGEHEGYSYFFEAIPESERRYAIEDYRLIRQRSNGSEYTILESPIALDISNLFGVLHDGRILFIGHKSDELVDIKQKCFVSMARS